IIAVARKSYSNDTFRKKLQKSFKKHLPQYAQSDSMIASFLGHVSYCAVDLMQDGDHWKELQNHIAASAHDIKIAYLAVAPALFLPICQRLYAMGNTGHDMRIVIEKPFGHDQKSAIALNREISSYFPEKQLFRIDHYLGKETVQNLMAIRFANSFFHHIWDAQHIDHIQITVAEQIGVAGRGGYYDDAGAMRDMVQNHLMQLLCLVAMEPPNRYHADAVRTEKLKVIEALEPMHQDNIEKCLVMGQYETNGTYAGFCDDIGQKSRTESFVALRCNIANFRWNKMPFYLRTGKRMPAQLSEILIAFKTPNHSFFGEKIRNIAGNALIIRLQPDEAIKMMMTIKTPGPGGFRLSEVPLDMSFANLVGGTELPEAYERLVMDVVRNDQTLFMRGDEVEAAWGWIDPIIRAKDTIPLHKYRAFQAGPAATNDILCENHQWREIS
ncbi:MAG: glucose-6-phosphate dehydrogenase, partial [Pseudomonadota bacterium]